MSPSTRVATQSISALPIVANLTLYTGDDFFMRLVVYDAAGNVADLTGTQAEAQIRATATTDPPLASFVATITGNEVMLHLTSADSTLLPPKAVWDCQLTSADGIVTTVTTGTITMTPEVTRP